MPGAPDRLLRRLEWQVVRRLDGQLQGAYRTVYRGTGIDFADLRAYTAEDDVRHIDWNVTARLDEPYVRKYAEDRELTAWLVLDRSASMAAAKDTTLADLAVSLGRLFTHGGNRVGAILYDNDDRTVLPPRTGRTHILRLAHELTRTSVLPQAAARPAGRTTDLAAMLRLASSTARRRSLVFVISDLIGDVDWEPALTRLGQRHETVVLRVVDPVESELPDLGLVLVEDAETGEQLLADTSDPWFQQRLRAEVAAREEAIAAALRRAGVVAHRVGTDEDLVRVLIGLIRQSKRRRR